MKKMDVYRKATSYRLASLSLNQPPLRLQKKTVNRSGKKVPPSSNIYDDDTASTATIQTGTGDFFDLDEDYNYDEEEPPMERRSYIRVRNSHPSQAAYHRACAMLGVSPSDYFLRYLPTTEIIMKDYLLGVAGGKACALALMSNCTVKKLNLEGNELGPQGAKHIAGLLRENTFITDLTLSENKLGREGARVFAELMRDNLSIKRLDLSANGFEEGDAIYFAEILEESHSLQELHLHHNNFREKGGEILGPAIAVNVSVEVLDLSWNHLRRKGAVAVATGLKKNIGLLRVNLSWNGLYLDGSRALTAGLAGNHNLLEIDLSCNRIDHECLVHILKGLQQNQTLTTLKLGQNPITTDGANALLAAMEHIPQIKELDISGQSVDRDFVRALNKLQVSRDLKVTYGRVLGMQDELQFQEDEFFLDEDPMMVLMEFMKLSNLRLVDLFSSLDKDGSWSLTRQEIREGLMSVNIPLSARALDRLISKLDIDKNGEIDFKELMEAQKSHRKRVTRIMKQTDANKETQMEIIRERLRTLMAARAFVSSRPGSASRNGSKGNGKLGVRASPKRVPSPKTANGNSNKTRLRLLSAVQRLKEDG